MKSRTVFSNLFQVPCFPFRLKEEKSSWGRKEGGREKARALFLVKLIEDYNYDEGRIRLKVEVPENGEADIVVYKDKQPYILAECRGAEERKKEIKKAQKDLFRKADLLDVRYGVLVVGRDRVVFDVQPKPLPLTELPKGEK